MATLARANKGVSDPQVYLHDTDINIRLNRRKMPTKGEKCVWSSSAGQGNLSLSLGSARQGEEVLNDRGNKLNLVWEELSLVIIDNCPHLTSVCPAKALQPMESKATNHAASHRKT